MTTTPQNEIRAGEIATFVERAGYGPPVSVQRVRGGGNNRGYRVDTRGSALFLKEYFRHPQDPRDRLSAEFRFCSFLWDSGIRFAPRPLGSDSERGLGLYEYLAGSTPEQAAEAEVSAALAFYAQTNRKRETDAALPIEAAAEACFSFADHMEGVDRRVARVQTISADDDLQDQALQFARGPLSRGWTEVRAAAVSRAGASGVEITRPLSLQERCLSPSDFGFHNALKTEQGIRFIDFEYAGWDDPAKMLCDFFLQEKVPVPLAYWNKFLDLVASLLPDPALEKRRIPLLYPVHQVKWCCIYLNEFLPVSSARRRFAASDADSGERKLKQLEKAEKMLENATNRIGPNSE